MSIAVAVKLAVYVAGLGLLIGLVGGLVKRALSLKTLPFSVAFPRVFTLAVVGIVLFAAAAYFDPHPGLLIGLPLAGMAGMHRLLRRWGRTHIAPPEGAADESMATTPGAPAKPNTLETVINIAVGFAIAFAVRHLAVEAFRVSESAHEPTIFGRHFKVVCNQCGGQFTEMELGVQPPAIMPCPGCGGVVRIEGKVKAADRVLVEKLSEPSRWDLACFQQVSPETDRAGKLITRIVGLPGETVEVGLGDVFINGQRLVKPADRFEHLWFPVGDTAWSASKHPLGGWVSETDATGPLLRYTHAVIAPLVTGIDESKPEIRVSSRPVRDMRVVADIAAQQAGSVELSWNMGDLRASMNVDRGKSTMLLHVGDQSRRIAVTVAASVGLAVRDGVVSAMADGRVVGTCPFESQASVDHLERARRPAVPCVLLIRSSTVPSRIRVWRDVHYFIDADSAEPIIRARLGDPFRLQANSFFVLGDNSGVAGDSRTFTAVAPKHQGYCQAGALSKEMFVGVVRWVYWPIERSRAVR